jgi:SAM-dependent methyltransferase
MTQPNDSGLLTIAGFSNYLPFLPWGYENIWRPRSLAQLSGENLPVERELKLLNDWLAVQARELVIDLGSSTDLYARGIGKQNADATIVAIDMSMGMLGAGRAYARRDGVKNIAHIRAPAQRLPFADASFDALMCGGSLNEFRSMGEALQEAHRVCKPDGRLFAMSLLKATSLGGRFGQWNARLSGISFPTPDEFNATIESTGWTRERQQVFGVVVFTLLKPNVKG